MCFKKGRVGKIATLTQMWLMRIRLNRPFQAFSFFFCFCERWRVLLKFGKQSQSYRNEAQCSTCILAVFKMKTELGLLQLLLWVTFYFLQAFEQLKRTTENSVHMCFHGWWRCRAEMVPLSKRISETIKEIRGEFVDWYAFTITLVMLIGRASGASVFFSCIRCSAASHATGGLQAARGSIVRKVGGERKIVFFFVFF